ncbi:unnamed protein product [Brassica napus]|uniref:(rape) hypothetical protein n=1 Tax=Brassica napus TaxID=3708 RepID=A0A816KNK0_BRANA|nr:unnamed protein product [Brassica napus]
MSDPGKRGRIDEVKLLLGEMKRRRIKPDVVIYNIMVNHLCSEALCLVFGKVYSVISVIKDGGFCCEALLELIST